MLTVQLRTPMGVYRTGRLPILRTQHDTWISPLPPQELRRSVGQLQSALVQKLSVLDKYEHVLGQVNAVAMDRLIDPTTQVNLLSVCEDPQVLAQQLTHIELVRHPYLPTV